METAAKVKRIGELMVRKDEIELERDEVQPGRGALSPKCEPHQREPR